VVVSGGVTIPRAHRAALEEIVGLDDARRIDLVDRLDSAGSDESAIREAVESVVKHEQGFDALLSAAIYRSSQNMTASAAAVELVGAMDLSTAPEGFASVLESVNLVLLAKVVDLRTTYEKRLIHARVLTDARPLFDDSPEARPMGSTIVHTLQLTSAGTPHMDETFIALGLDDLRELQEQIQRAIAKHDQLRTALEDGPLKIVGEEGDDQ
jgi:hypothetical protein